MIFLPEKDLTASSVFLLLPLFTLHTYAILVIFSYEFLMYESKFHEKTTVFSLITPSWPWPKVNEGWILDYRPIGLYICKYNICESLKIKN